jgi:hypothetical protein
MNKISRVLSTHIEAQSIVFKAEQTLKKAHEEYNKFREFYKLNIEKVKNQVIYKDTLDLILKGEKVENGTEVLYANYLNSSRKEWAYYAQFNKLKITRYNDSNRIDFEMPSMKNTLHSCTLEIYSAQEVLLNARKEFTNTHAQLIHANSEQKNLCMKQCEEAQQILDDYNIKIKDI